MFWEQMPKFLMEMLKFCERMYKHWNIISFPSIFSPLHVLLVFYL